MGATPERVGPARELPAGTAPMALSFGDGPHRCPGAHVAIQESDILLSRLFARPGLTMTSPPRVTVKEDIFPYELHDLTVSVTRSSS